MMLLNNDFMVANIVNGNGYIAGCGTGIVTVLGSPASREVLCIDTRTKAVVQRAVSTSQGHYIFYCLDARRTYLVICRDLPPNGTDQRYEPVAWDYVTPATDLTVTEQRALWDGWADEAYQAQAQG